MLRGFLCDVTSADGDLLEPPTYTSTTSTTNISASDLPSRCEYFNIIVCLYYGIKLLIMCLGSCFLTVFLDVVLLP